MKRTLAGLLGLAVMFAGAMLPVDAAHAKKKKEKEAPAASATTTDIDSCAKLPAGERDSCISRSRPVTGSALYRKWATKKAEGAVAGAAEKAKSVAADAAEKAKGAAAAAVDKAKAVGKEAMEKGKQVVASMKAMPSGPTNIDDCGKYDASLRDACISRSKPVSGADLYKKWKK